MNFAFTGDRLIKLLNTCNIYVENIELGEDYTKFDN